ncbi:hypothetical protein Tco_0418266 [Tanacetum coccineum]
MAPSPASAQLKPFKRCQKRTTQTEDAPRCVAWSIEEEIALCNGWVHVSENSAIGNARRESGFWNDFLRGVGDEDYFAKALLDYEAEYGVSFTLRHC